MRIEMDGRGSGWRVLAPCGVALLLVGCSGAEPTSPAEVEPTSPAGVEASDAPSASAEGAPESPSEPVPTASPGETAATATASPGLPTSASVRLVDAAPADPEESAVLAAYAGFWDDWMAVAATPREPVPASEHTDGQGQVVLDQLATTLTEAGNGIEGTLVMDGPVVSFDEVRRIAVVTSCADQGELVPVPFDGSPGVPEAQQRLVTEVALVRSGARWTVSGRDITGTPC